MVMTIASDPVSHRAIDRLLYLNSDVLSTIDLLLYLQILINKIFNQQKIARSCNVHLLRYVNRASLSNFWEGICIDLD